MKRLLMCSGPTEIPPVPDLRMSRCIISAGNVQAVLACCEYREVVRRASSLEIPHRSNHC